MKKLAILNYQFAPMLEKLLELELDFPDWEKVDPQLSFENRQQIFGKIFDEDYDNVHPIRFEWRKRHYPHVHLMRPTDDIIVFRVVNKRTTKITNREFNKDAYDDYQNCVVVFDNRPGVQRLLVEVKPSAFTDTATLIKLLEESINRILKYYKLEISLDPIFRVQDFVDTVNRFDEGFREVAFHLPHKNLDRVMEEMDLTLHSIRESWKTEMHLVFKAPKGGRVPINLEDKDQMELVKLASGIGGATINMTPTGKSRQQIHCGEGRYVMEPMDENIFTQLSSNNPDRSLFEEDSPLNRLKLAMKNIKNHYD